MEPVAGKWTGKPTKWIEGRTLYVSVPFTWNLPELRAELQHRSLFWDSAIVGGPATRLLPDYLAGMEWVTIGTHMDGVLQRVNPLATRTTEGCSRRCKFCAIGKGLIEGGGMRELDDWPDLPILCDNNLLAASQAHFDRVMDRLERWGWADFNQGLDARLLTDHHAERISRLSKPIVRMALDSVAEMDSWENAFGMLRKHGIPRRSIKSYCLIAFRDTPQDAWKRCEWVEKHGARALPMWYHRLDQLERNAILPEQVAKGWTRAEQLRIMGYYYKHRGKPPVID